MAAKRYRVKPVAPDRFEVQVWVGWRIFGSWEPARQNNGKEAWYEDAATAERHILVRREEESIFDQRRRDNEARNRAIRAFQAANLPYEFPRD